MFLHLGTFFLIQYLKCVLSLADPSSRSQAHLQPGRPPPSDEQVPGPQTFRGHCGSFVYKQDSSQFEEGFGSES